jgi:hypothetical protein
VTLAQALTVDLFERDDRRAGRLGGSGLALVTLAGAAGVTATLGTARGSLCSRWPSRLQPGSTSSTTMTSLRSTAKA